MTTNVTFPQGQPTDFNLDHASEILMQHALHPGSLRKSSLDKILSYPEVEVIERPSKRRLPQPRYKMDYEALPDFQRRLQNTIIFVGSDPYYVKDVVAGQGDFILHLVDEKKKNFHVKYSCPFIDARTPEPKYLQLPDYGAGFFARLPKRQQSQGWGHQNTFFKLVGINHPWTPINDWLPIVGIFKRSDSVVWTPVIKDMMVSLRLFSGAKLSDKIAMFHDPFCRIDKKHELWAEYKGRILGPVEDQTIFCRTKDTEQPWIRRDIQTIGFEIQEWKK